MNIKTLLLTSALIPAVVFADKSATQAWVSNQVNTAIMNQVPSWARAENKPSYSADEIAGAMSTNTTPELDLSWSSIGMYLSFVNAKSFTISNDTEMISASNGTGKLTGTWTLNNKNIATEEYVNTMSNNLQAVIDDLPTGGGTATVDQDDVKDLITSNIYNTASWVLSEGNVAFTEHPVKITIDDATDTIQGTGDWPETKCVFLYVVFDGATSFQLGTNVKVCGYYSAPTSNFQAIMWKLDGYYYINVISKTE